jgi:hypothetical protein
MRKLLVHISTSEIHRFSNFWWYRFQNSTTVRDIDLKFDMEVVFERLEDIMHVFLPGSVQK